MNATVKIKQGTQNWRNLRSSKYILLQVMAMQFLLSIALE